MRTWIFSLKRAVCRPMFLLLLAAYVASILLAGSVGESASLPTAGVYDGSQSVSSRRMIRYLTENGFVQFEDAEDMKDRVRTGKLDCAVILPEDLETRLAEDRLEQCVPWIVSPTSFVPDLYQDHVAAAIFREHTPHLTADLFEGTGVSRQAVLDSFDTVFEEGYLFTFDIQYDGEVRTASDLKQRSTVMSVSSILMCALVFSFCVDLVVSSFRETVGRLGLRRTLFRLVVPGALVRVLAAVLAGWIGLAVVGLYDLMLPLLIHAFVLLGTGLVLAGVLPNARQLYILLSILVVGSIALCPIYADIADQVPVLDTIRCILPPYWLWLLMQAQSTWMVVAVALPLCGIGVLLIRYAGFEKYRLK